MKITKTQFAEAVTCDFLENEVTYEFENDFTFSAGVFAILPKENYEALITALKGIKNSMQAHPDCTAGSEFEDMVARCNDVLDVVNGIER